MPRPKARYTKSATMQVRVLPETKAILERYAERLNMTVSALLRLTLKNLADIASRQ